MTSQAIATPGRLSIPADHFKRRPFTGASADAFAHPTKAEEESTGLPTTGNILSDRLTLSLEIGDEWGKRENWAELRSIILNLRSLARASMFPLSPEIEWPIATPLLEDTETEISPAFNKLNEEAIEFVEQLSLREGVDWLQVAIPYFFSGADFEIELLPAEEEKENMLAVRVYGSLSASEFRERRHAMCKALREAGHKRLYEVISIFQRRTRNDGWQAVSWYSSLSAE